MGRAEFDAELEALQGQLSAENDRVGGMVRAALEAFPGLEVRPRSTELEPARQIAEQIRAKKAERAARSRAIPRDVRQRLSEAQNQQANIEHTIAHLERKVPGLQGEKRATAQARLAEMRARRPEAKQRADAALQAYEDAFDAWEPPSNPA